MTPFHNAEKGQKRQKHVNFFKPTFWVPKTVTNKGENENTKTVKKSPRDTVVGRESRLETARDMQHREYTTQSDVDSKTVSSRDRIMYLLCRPT